MKNRLKNLGEYSKESNNRITIIDQYQGRLATRLFSQKDVLTVDDVNQIKNNLNEIEDFNSIPDNVHDLLKSSFDLGKRINDDFKIKHADTNDLSTELLETIKNGFNEISEKISNRGAKRTLPETMPSEALASSIQSESKKSKSDDLDTITISREDFESIKELLTNVSQDKSSSHSNRIKAEQSLDKVFGYTPPSLQIK